MQVPNPRTPSLLRLCNKSTHTCDKKHKLLCLRLQDHPWRFRLSVPLMTREGSNFYNTESWDSSRNNTGRRHERGILLSLKNLIKTCLGFPLYTRSKTLNPTHHMGLGLSWKILQKNNLLDFRSIEPNFRSIEPDRIAQWILQLTRFQLYIKDL